MPITFHCTCGRTLQIGEEHAGHRGKCPACGAVLHVPVYALAFAESGSTPALPAIPFEERQPDSETDDQAAEKPRPDMSHWNAITGDVTAPPAAEPSANRRTYYKLHSPAAVAVASILGSFLAGTLILTYSFHLVGNKRAAGYTLLGGVIATAAVFILLLFLPGLLVLGGLVLATPLIMWGVAQSVYGSTYRRHREQGGDEASVPGAAGLGLICCVVFAIVWWIGFFPFTHADPFESVALETRSIYYAGGVTKAEAQQIVDLMIEIGIFDVSEPYIASPNVWVWKSSDGYVVSYMYQKDAWNKPEIITAWRELRKLLIKKVYPDQQVQIWLCDKYKTPKRVISE
jgi:hypothetical protein